MAIDVEKQGDEQPEETMDMGSPTLVAPDSQPVNPPSSSPLLPPDSASALPADAASKRQRRPNVRLNEIGSESSLANVVEYLLKRKGRPGVVVGAKRGRPPRDDKLASPGKLPKKSKHLPKLNSDDKPVDGDGVGVGDGNGVHHAEVSKPHSQKAYDNKKLTAKGKHRKAGGLGKSHNIDTGITKHAKRPKVVSPRVEGNGNNWMHKAADGFLEAADGCVYGSSDNDKRVRNPSPHAQPVNLSVESDSPKGFRKIQAATKRKKKAGAVLKSPPATECARKDGAVEEKEEPSSSALQELRMQGPMWERGVPPLDEKVREWMLKIGLEKYALIFQHHEVGDDVLPLLTMDDLKEMGITAVGARRKFFSEITKRRQSLMLSNESLADEK